MEGSQSWVASAQPQMAFLERTFGLDYFISYDQKVWLIEVNENPCIECSSTLLSKLIPRMLNDSFKPTVDQIMDKKPTEDKAYHVEGYDDHESIWVNLGELTASTDLILILKFNYFFDAAKTNRLYHKL